MTNDPNEQYDDFTAQEQSDEYIPDWYDAREEYYEFFSNVMYKSTKEW